MSATRTKWHDIPGDAEWTNNPDRLKLDLTAGTLPVGPFGFKDVSYTLDAGVKGVGGIQKGSTLAPNTWYDSYGLTDGSGNAFEMVLVPNGTALDLERGLTYSQLRGDFLTNAASEFYRFFQFGGWWYWNENTTLAPFLILDAVPPAGAWTLASLLGAICPHAHQYAAAFYCTSVAGEGSAVYIRPTGSNIVAGPSSAAIFYSARGAAQPEGARAIDIVDAAQSIEYQSANCTTYMFLRGYYDPHAL